MLLQIKIQIRYEFIAAKITKIPNVRLELSNFYENFSGKPGKTKKKHFVLGMPTVRYNSAHFKIPYSAQRTLS